MTGNELANKVLVDQSAMGCANSLMENLDLVIKALRAYDKALVPEAVEKNQDTERFFYVCDGFDGFDDLDFHEEASNQAWGKEPTKEHYLAAYRKIVDAMILRKSGTLVSPPRRKLVDY